MLKRFTASQYEYLETKDTVGNITHLPGYAYVFSRSSYKNRCREPTLVRLDQV